MAGFLAQAVRGGLRAGRALAPQVRSGRRRRPEGGRPPAAGGAPPAAPAPPSPRAPARVGSLDLHPEG